MVVDREQIEALRNMAQVLPYGETRMTLIEEAVRLADSLNDVVLGYEIRNDLLDTACFSGRPDLLMVNFAWCVAQFDRHPGLFDEYMFLWHFKWFAANLDEFAEISLKEIDKMMSEMFRRFSEFGSNLRPCYRIERDMCIAVGRMDQAKTAHDRYRRLRRDLISDCEACEADADCKYFSVRRRWAAAADLAERAVDNGLGCHSQPTGIQATSLESLLTVGRRDVADKYCDQCYKKFRRDVVRYQGVVADLLQYHALTGNTTRGLRILEAAIPETLNARSEWRRYCQSRFALMLMERIKLDGKTQVKVRLPDPLPPSGKSGATDVDALSEWFRNDATEIGRKFDKRNGNSLLVDAIDEIPDDARRAAKKWPKE